MHPVWLELHLVKLESIISVSRVSVPSADLIGDNQANFSLELNRWVSFSMLLYQTIYVVNTPRQNGPHYTDDIFKSIFLNEYVWIPIKILLRIVPKGPINNIPALIQIMAWRRLGDKPLSEPIIASLPRHICVARPQWVNLVTTQYFNGFMQRDTTPLHQPGATSLWHQAINMINMC